MHLFAIEAEASVSELHLSSVLKPIGKPAGLRNAAATVPAISATPMHEIRKTRPEVIAPPTP
jgi:hypothetical protein